MNEHDKVILERLGAVAVAILGAFSNQWMLVAVGVTWLMATI